ncbi:MAG TPA: carboxypeptidase-like regulatory domain-containing protein, partial [Bryobacteraceae bacterium]|nr:carboxypeptidase-like regulatory domain-containing protein [Bryobacteraceae bacterium]
MRQVLLIAALVYPLAAQRQTGELRLTVNDAAGLPLEAQIEVTSHTADTRRILSTASDGRLDVRELPFGTYLLKAERSGFRTHSEALEVRAETPIERRIVLGLGRVETSVTISDSVTLVNPQQVGSAVVLSRDTIEHRRSVSPGRGVLELVNNQPGWLLEANGVLHPRGSEYDTQYVIDGAPILDNRSPAFGPAFEPDELSAVRIITSGFPAEYGRKLGGVVELSTARETRNGFHGLLT